MPGILYLPGAKDLEEELSTWDRVLHPSIVLLSFGVDNAQWLPARALLLPLPRPANREMGPRALCGELHEIAARYAAFEIIGEPEIREVNPAARYFAPHRPNVNNLGRAFTIITKPAPLVPVLGVAT